LWRCKRNDIEVYWDSTNGEIWNKYQKNEGKHFPVCNRWKNGRCLEDNKPCDKGGKHNIEKIPD